MALIQTLNLDGTIVEFYDDYIPENKKENLEKMYDVVNKIAQELDPKITKNWFYKTEEIEKMKKSEKYKFL